MLHIKINSPEGIIWEGEANSVTSENTQGVFDILPEHANFITIIENKPIVIATSAEKKEYKFDRAVIFNREDRVSIYTHL